MNHQRSLTDSKKYTRREGGRRGSVLFLALLLGALAVLGPAVSVPASGLWPEGPEITAGAALLLDEDSGVTLYAKNADSTLSPGAIVKIMTVLICLENSQMDEEVTMTETGVAGVTDGGFNISAQVGEIFTMEQCLHAIMLASANDICLQVAEHVGGTVDGFVKMMNERARELGCTRTKFTNPTGMSDEEQVSTAHDFALITCEAFKNEAFCDLAAAVSYTIPATNISGGERVLTNSFALTSPENGNYYENCLGGKEGFTQASGQTLVCAAANGDLTLIAVILQGDFDWTDSEAATLLDFGFQSFQRVDVGAEDFYVVEGGVLLLPVGTARSSISSKDSEDGDGRLVRSYYLDGVKVGTAIVDRPPAESETVSQNGEKNLQEAEDFSAEKSPLPYVLIPLVSIVIIILLIRRMVKIAGEE